MLSARRRRPRVPSFQCGDLVEIRAESEILGTLDSQGKLEGIPFMPEMAKYCGRRFRVHRRAQRVFLDHHYYVAGMKGAVLLEDVRCEGASHGGCQMGCLLFWRDSWLKHVDATDAAEHAGEAPCCSGSGGLTITEGDRFRCQATELIRATSPLPWWDARQYVRDLTSRDLTLTQLARMLGLLACNKLRGMFGLGRHGMIAGRQGHRAGDRLNLQPGEIVEVKGKKEIEATLDEHGRTGGLGFAAEMLDCCGRRYRVAKRVDRVVLEWSGEMRPIRDTVILEGVTCNGLSRRGCPRNCFQLWREAWLKRVA
jgi:hypothetical protein